MHNKRASCQQGFTLIEAMIVIAIVAIVLSLAVPSFNDFFEKNRLKRAAEEVYGLITKARAEAVIRSVDMRVDVDAGTWCLGYEERPSPFDPPCNCANANSCTVDVAGTPVTQVVSGADFSGVTITESFAGVTFFDTVKGTAGNGTVSLSAADWDLDVVVSNMGRVRICAPSSSQSTMGYRACP
ncbi:hypothetical protein A9Q89_12260 [Gammaproteobacteria bacterium 53_120_T64]|nr:hypothetical protein A9Q89_12260 [Gammaproteobacteria bacterium 53_120_T64]